MVGAFLFIVFVYKVFALRFEINTLPTTPITTAVAITAKLVVDGHFTKGWPKASKIENRTVQLGHFK